MSLDQASKGSVYQGFFKDLGAWKRQWRENTITILGWLYTSASGLDILLDLGLIDSGAWNPAVGRSHSPPDVTESSSFIWLRRRDVASPYNLSVWNGAVLESEVRVSWPKSDESL